MNRRRFAAGLAATIISAKSVSAFAKESPVLSPVRIDESSFKATPSATSVSQTNLYDGDIEDFWFEPWEIGDTPVEIGATIRKRYVAKVGEGFLLGDEGLTFRSVVFATHQVRDFFIGSQTDLSEIKDAKTLKAVGVYGGIHSYDVWEDPILIAFELIAP